MESRHPLDPSGKTRRRSLPCSHPVLWAPSSSRRTAFLPREPKASFKPEILTTQLWPIILAPAHYPGPWASTHGPWTSPWVLGEAVEFCFASSSVLPMEAWFKCQSLWKPFKIFLQRVPKGLCRAPCPEPNDYHFRCRRHLNDSSASSPSPASCLVD